MPHNTFSVQHLPARPLYSRKSALPPYKHNRLGTSQVHSTLSQSICLHPPMNLSNPPGHLKYMQPRLPLDRTPSNDPQTSLVLTFTAVHLQFLFLSCHDTPISRFRAPKLRPYPFKHPIFTAALCSPRPCSLQANRATAPCSWPQPPRPLHVTGRHNPAES